jgi:hypothetical protein
MFKLIGSLSQVLGIFWILFNQYKLYSKAKKEFGNFKKLFLWISFSRIAISDEELKNLSNEETIKMFNGFPLAKWLYEDFRDTVYALILSLIGTIITFLG